MTNRTTIEWTAGNKPEIPEGKAVMFLVASQCSNGRIHVGVMEYLNRHRMPCSDGCEPSENAEPVGDDEDEYYWTGWFQQSCSHCDTSWSSSGEGIIAYAPMPKYEAAQHKVIEPAKPSGRRYNSVAEMVEGEAKHKEEA